MIRLSPRQRDVLLHAKPDGWQEYWTIEECTMQALERHGIVEKRFGVYEREFRLTDLGRVYKRGVLAQEAT